MLIVEDEEALRASLKRIFTKDGFQVEVADSAEKGLDLVESSLFDVIITDIILPRMDGIEMLGRIRELHPEQVCIVVTAYASLDTAVKALRAGAYDYIMKPIIHEEIKQVVNNALRQRSLQMENALLKREIGKTYDFQSVIGESEPLKAIMAEVKKIADSRTNVLLLGETGTGKELLARVIHQNSPRASMPFVPINCSAIPEALLESELFGHVKGAFTGAVNSKKGLLEEADGGTVFLDEIGELSTAFQAKLLRVLEDQEIRPLGSTRSSRVDIRFITATNKDLNAALAKGEFREDLFYRINVMTVQIPPLRERKGDIPLLVSSFVHKYSRELGKKVSGVSQEALSLMTGYRWPGNIRELQNVMERAVLIADGDTIVPENLPETVRRTESFFEEKLREGLTIEDYTRTFVLRYQDTYSEQEIADMLGITRKTLWEKRKKWGLKRPLLQTVTEEKE